jgi:hypothetical protein
MHWPRPLVAVTLLAALGAEAASPKPVMSRSNRRTGLAVIVGIERYRGGIPNATNARHDAEVFAGFAEKTLGIPKSRIKLLLDDGATSADLAEALGKWLSENAKPDSSVWFYYSGHGTPSPATGDSLLVPYDSDPDEVDRRGLPVSQLTGILQALPVKERFVILDACFSGNSERSVLSRGKRPLVPIKDLAAPPPAMVVFAATEGKGTSGPAHGAAHGLFTFHLLNGLRGSADKDSDGVVTVAELANYTRTRVSEEAAQYGGRQLPQVQVGELGALPVVEDPGSDAVWEDPGAGREPAGNASMGGPQAPPEDFRPPVRKAPALKLKPVSVTGN